MQKPTGKSSAPISGLAVFTDTDGEGGGEGEDGAGHVGADQGVAGGHQQLGFAGVHHLGDELGGGEVGHVVSFVFGRSCCSGRASVPGRPAAAVPDPH